MCPCHKVVQQYLGLHSGECGQPAEGSDPSSSLHTGEATPRVLVPVLDSPVQEEIHGHIGETVVKSHDDEGTGASLI